MKKELASVRACWNWAVLGGSLKGTFPRKGLLVPKEKEKMPFRTFAEIESLIASEAHDESQLAALWKSLYLTRQEIEELLSYMQQNGTQPCVYPLVAFAAYTGARRSEMLRTLVTDVDLAGGTVTVRENKRVKGRRSNRTSPITPRLAEALREWLTLRPSSPFLFCQAQRVTRSKTVRQGPTGVTEDEAHDHFKRTTDSKWQVGATTCCDTFLSAL